MNYCDIRLNTARDIANASKQVLTNMRYAGDIIRQFLHHINATNGPKRTYKGTVFAHLGP